MSRTEWLLLMSAAVIASGVGTPNFADASDDIVIGFATFYGAI
jgi:hypothetical protein